MIWPAWAREHARIVKALQNHASPIPGVKDPAILDVLAWQIIASLRREIYYRHVQSRPISAYRADPNHPSFDAERAVAHHVQLGNIDEAGWLIFLMTHFARPVDTGWLRLRDVYGCLGKGRWDWKTVAADPARFSDWLSTNWKNIRGKFGNHRKYESLRPDSHRPMSKVVDAYVEWIGPTGHANFYRGIVAATGNDPHKIFDCLYKKLNIPTFGRLAKFDYLSMIGRYNLAPISAGSAYLDGATGPARGARLLFEGQRDGVSTTQELQTRIDNLDKDLKVGMAVMEDALCNWQKSPSAFVHFKG